MNRMEVERTAWYVTWRLSCLGLPFLVKTTFERSPSLLTLMRARSFDTFRRRLRKKRKEENKGIEEPLYGAIQRAETSFAFVILALVHALCSSFERHGFVSRVAGNGKLFPLKSRRREATNAEEQGRIDYLKLRERHPVHDRRAFYDRRAFSKNVM